MPPQDQNMEPQLGAAPSATEPAAPSQSAAPPQPPQATAPSLRDRLSSELGIDTTNWEDDGQVVDLLRHVQDAFTQQQQLAQYGQRYIQEYDQFEKWKQSQQQQQLGMQQQQPAEPEPEYYWPKSPDWKPEWENQITFDRNGQMVASDPALLPKYQSWLKWRRDRQEALLQDPVRAMDGGLRNLINSVLDERGVLSQQQVQQQREQEFANSFVIANREWLYQSDPRSGQPLRDQSGNPVLSPLGAALANEMWALEQDGVKDPARQLDRALKSLQPYFQQMQAQAAQQPQAAQQAAPNGVDPKERFLAGAGHSPNRSNTVSRSALPHVPQNERQSYQEMLQQAGRDKGLF